MVVTVSGNEITDATRVTNTQGDGHAAPNSSYGIWEATTNLLVNGGVETNTTGWTAISGTLTRITSAAKFGTAAGNIVTSNLIGNEGASQGFTGAAATYTASAWVLGVAGGTVQIGIQDNAIMRAVSSPVTLTGTWQRITVTAATVTATNPRVYMQTDVKQSITFQVDGVQCEAKAFATPYVETNGSTAGRTVANVTAPASNLSEIQGWVAARVRFGSGPTGTNQNIFSIDSGANYIYIFNSGTNVSLIHLRNSVAGTTITFADVPAGGQYATVVAAWTNTTISLSYNGSAFTTVARGAAGGTAWPATFNLGGSVGTILLDGVLLWFACGTGTLSNAAAASLSARGNTDPTPLYLHQLDFAADCPTLLWTADTTATLINAQGGFDFGFTYQCWQYYYDSYANLNQLNGITTNMLDDPTPATSANNGRHYNLSTEVELNTVGQAFTPQLGAPGQAYQIGSRFQTIPASPMIFDYVSGGPHPTPYTAYLRQDFFTPLAPNVHHQPFQTTAFHWLGLTEYQDKGGKAPLGFIDRAVLTYTGAIGATNNSSTATAFRAICGLLFTYPVMIVATVPVGAGGTLYTQQPTFVMSGGTGGGASGHGVLTSGAVSSWVVDTPGSYTVAPTGITVTRGAGDTTGTGATGGTPTTSVAQFFGALDLNMFVAASTPAFPKLATYVTDGEPYVRACIQGVAPTWYGYASVDASANAAIGVAPIVLNAVAASRTITWQTIFNYLTTTMDQNVPAIVGGAVPNAASTTPYIPRPMNGNATVRVKGVNYAVENNMSVVGATVILDHSLAAMGMTY